MSCSNVFQRSNLPQKGKLKCFVLLIGIWRILRGRFTDSVTGANLREYTHAHQKQWSVPAGAASLVDNALWHRQHSGCWAMNGGAALKALSLLFGKAPDVLWQCCSPAVRSTPGLMQTPLTGGLCSTLFQLNFPIQWWSWRLLGVAEIILSVNIVKARHVAQKCDSSSTNF